MSCTSGFDINPASVYFIYCCKMRAEPAVNQSRVALCLIWLAARPVISKAGMLLATFWQNFVYNRKAIKWGS
jgi:hypothetical protein